VIKRYTDFVNENSNIDNILDKISSNGYDKLTSWEKEYLASYKDSNKINKLEKEKEVEEENKKKEVEEFEEKKSEKEKKCKKEKNGWQNCIDTFRERRKNLKHIVFGNPNEIQKTKQIPRNPGIDDRIKNLSDDEIINKILSITGYADDPSRVGFFDRYLKNNKYKYLKLLADSGFSDDVNNIFLSVRDDYHWEDKEWQDLLLMYYDNDQEMINGWFRDILERRKYTLIKDLLNLGADINWKSLNGYSMLHWVIREWGYGKLKKLNLSFTRTIKILLENGADPNSTDVNGDTILDLLNLDDENKKQLKNILKLLIKYGADVDKLSDARLEKIISILSDD